MRCVRGLSTAATWSTTRTNSTTGGDQSLLIYNQIAISEIILLSILWGTYEALLITLSVILIIKCRNRTSSCSSAKTNYSNWSSSVSQQLKLSTLKSPRSRTWSSSKRLAVKTPSSVQTKPGSHLLPRYLCSPQVKRPTWCHALSAATLTAEGGIRWAGKFRAKVCTVQSTRRRSTSAVNGPTTAANRTTTRRTSTNGDTWLSTIHKVSDESVKVMSHYL